MSRTAEAFLGDKLYPLSPGYREATTSKTAAAKVASAAETLREDVYAVIRLAGARGLTADECAAMLQRDWRSVRPRVSELRAVGRIVATGERRKNDTGLGAAVWRAK